MMHPADIDRLGLAIGSRLRCSQSGRDSVVLEVAADDRLARGVVCISAAHAATSALGDMIGPIELEAA